MPLSDNVKRLRALRGWTQQELAAKAGMSQQGIDAIESGAVGRPRRLLELASALGVSAPDLLGDAPVEPSADSGRPMGAVIALPPPATDVDLSFRALPKDVPVLGVSAAGTGGDFHFNGETIDYVRRPPSLDRVRDVFAIYVTGDSMWPRYDEGQPVYVSAARVPAIGDDVIVELQPSSDGDPSEAFLKRLVRRTPTKIVVEQFNPPLVIEFEKDEVKRLYRVIPWVELMS